MSANQRRSQNGIMAGVFGIMSYISFYRAVVDPYIPKETYVKIQICILGLLLLGVLYSILMLRTISNQDYYSY